MALRWICVPLFSPTPGFTHIWKTESVGNRCWNFHSTLADRNEHVRHEDFARSRMGYIYEKWTWIWEWKIRRIHTSTSPKRTDFELSKMFSEFSYTHFQEKFNSFNFCVGIFSQTPGSIDAWKTKSVAKKCWNLLSTPAATTCFSLFFLVVAQLFTSLKPALQKLSGMLLILFSS